MNWETYRKHLGKLKEGTTIKFYFKSREKLDIKEIVPSCSGCTTIGGYKDNRLSVTFKTKKLPKHFKTLGKDIMNTVNGITVKYKDGTQEQLIFTATIYK